MIQRVLMMMARAVLDTVLQQLMKLVNSILEQAMRPMQMMMQKVMDGVWIGEGANQFVEEVRTMMMPGVDKVSQQITTHSSRLQTARDIIDRADADVNKIVRGQVFDVFKFY